MYARVATFEGAENVDEMIAQVKSDVEHDNRPPGLEDAKGMIMGVDRSTRKIDRDHLLRDGRGAEARRRGAERDVAGHRRRFAHERRPLRDPCQRVAVMTQNPPEGFPRVTPYLLYHDCDAAVDFLTNALGFNEKVKMPGQDGKTMHAELDLEGGVIMLGNPGGDFKNPSELGGRTQTTYIYVDDVDAHYERAKAAGADIQREPEDQFYGDRSYSLHDPEGHSWSFATHTRDVSEEEMQAAMASAS